MEKQKLLSEDLVTTSRHDETRSANTVRKYSNPIPIDLLIDIFSRVPAKSIARFRCVSKSWESMFCRFDFTELFLTNAPSRPRLLLFAFKIKEEVFFFTSPQPQNPHNGLSLVATRYHKCFPNYFPSQICPPLCGFVLCKGWNSRMMVVCNPVTRESITLPKLKKIFYKSYIGYDPIEKRFKVLCAATSDYKGRYTYRVLTLETGKRYWRRIVCNLKAVSIHDGEVCINGVLYIPGLLKDSLVIVCFDIRFEKFSVVNMDDRMLLEKAGPLGLFNYKGKLVAHHLGYDHNVYSDTNVLWIREDAENRKWSKCICVLPPLCKGSLDRLFVCKYKIVGMSDTGDIVFSPRYLSNPFYVFYYNIERNTYTRVHIQVFEEFKKKGCITLHTSLDYEENNMKFL